MTQQQSNQLPLKCNAVSDAVSLNGYKPDKTLLDFVGEMVCFNDRSSSKYKNIAAFLINDQYLFSKGDNRSREKKRNPYKIAEHIANHIVLNRQPVNDSLEQYKASNATELTDKNYFCFNDASYLNLCINYKDQRLEVQNTKAVELINQLKNHITEVSCTTAATLRMK